MKLPQSFICSYSANKTSLIEDDAADVEFSYFPQIGEVTFCPLDMNMFGEWGFSSHIHLNTVALKTHLDIKYVLNIKYEDKWLSVEVNLTHVCWLVFYSLLIYKRQ